jgi:hypothetical protein
LLVNSDASAYSPVEVKEPGEKRTAASSSLAPESSSKATESAGPVQVGRIKYTDVHELSGTVPQSLGAGFIGDGTMGSGGASMG